MHRTQKQIDASRRNGSKSRGATTAAGRQRIVTANLKSGIYAASDVLPWEKAADLEQLKADYFNHHQPISPEARALLDDLISCEWTLRRLRRAETELLRYACDEITDWAEKLDGEPPDHMPGRCEKYDSQELERLQRRINSTRLAFHRALKALQSLEDREAEAAAHASAPAESPFDGDSQERVTPYLLNPPAGAAPPLPAAPNGRAGSRESSKTPPEVR